MHLQIFNGETMRKLKDLTSMRFGRMVVLRRTPPRISANGRVAQMVECKCDCGNVKIVEVSSLHAIKSCGCYRHEWASAHYKRIGKNRTVPMEGKIFGRLTVLARDGHRGKKIQYKCLCACGKIVVVMGGDLRSGATQSCGCLKVDSQTTHGHAGKKKSPEYHSWQAMWRRCTRPDARATDYYKNVRVCERWESFETFLADMGPRPKGTTLGRFEDDGPYDPWNCVWQTWGEQRNEQRNKRAILKTAPTKPIEPSQKDVDAAMIKALAKS